MQNLHGLFAWFEFNVFGYSTLVSLREGPRGGGAGPIFIFRPNVSLQGWQKLFLTGEGSLCILGSGWQVPHLLEAMNLPLKLIDLLGLMPCSIPVITGLKKKCFSLLKTQSYVRPDHCFSQTNCPKMATNSLQFMHFGGFSSRFLFFN